MSKRSYFGLGRALLCFGWISAALPAVAGTSFAEPCRSDRERPVLNDLVRATGAVVARDASSCGPALSDADRESLGKLRAELLGAIRAAKNEKDRAAAISKTLAAHERDLSPLAMATILSESARIRVAVIEEGLKPNPKLAKAMTAFEKAATQHIQNRNQTHRGLKGIERDDRRLEDAAARLKRAISRSSFDQVSKRILEKNMYTLQSLVYRNASNRALKEGDRASLYMDLLLIPKGMLSAELVAASYLGMTTPAGAGAKIATQVLTNAAAGAAGLLGLTELSSMGRMLGYAAVGQPKDGAFFCRLSDQLSKQSPEERRNALTAAILGGAFGAAYGGVAAVNYTAARVLGGMSSGMFAASTGKGAFDSHTKAKLLEAQAAQAQARGDLTAAAALREQANRAKVDTAASSMETVMLAFGSAKLTPKLGKGLKIGILKPSPAARAVKASGPASTTLAKAKTSGELCAIGKGTVKRAAASKQVAAGVASAGAASSLAGCGGSGGGRRNGETDSSSDTPDTGEAPVDGTPTGDTPTDPAAPSCAQTNTCAVKLAWRPPVERDPPVPVAGYKIYWGTSPGLYTNSIDVGNQLQAEIPGLGAGTYYFAATAYSDQSAESGFSNVVSKDFGPPAASDIPAAAARIIIGSDGQQRLEEPDPAGL